MATRTDGSWLYYDFHTSVTPCSRDPTAGAFPQCCQIATPASSTSQRGAQIVEIRGWIRNVSQDPKLSEDPADWHYDLELDLAWLERQRIDVHQLMKPGSISLHNRAGGDPLRLIRNVQPPTRPTALVSPAFLHVELTSWRPGQRFPTWTPIPAVPGRRSVDTPTSWDHVEPGPPDARGIRWPWDPRFPSDDPRAPLRDPTGRRRRGTRTGGGLPIRRSGPSCIRRIGSSGSGRRSGELKASRAWRSLRTTAS